MKSFIAAALIGLAVADEATDAATKLALEQQDIHGPDVGALTNAVPAADVTLDPAGAGSKGTLKLACGWRNTRGSDAEVYYGFRWEIVPTAAYNPDQSILDIAFSKSKYEAKINYTRFTRSVSNPARKIFTYAFTTLDRNMTSLEAGQGRLLSNETTGLGTDSLIYTITDTGLTIGTDPPKSSVYFKIDVENSSYTTGGAQVVQMERTGAGHEELKLGAAIYVYWQFTDAAGSQRLGQYMKWGDMYDDHDHDHGHSHDGASAFSMAAAALAVVYALF